MPVRTDVPPDRALREYLLRRIRRDPVAHAAPFAAAAGTGGMAR
jgi:hypothetical protein